MALKFTNNASTTLAAAVTATDLTITVATGKGALFDALLYGGDTQVLTITDAARTKFEIVYAWGTAGDVLNVDRAQEGTTAQNWNSGDIVFSGVTAGVLKSLQTSLDSASVNLSPDTTTYSVEKRTMSVGGNPAYASFVPRNYNSSIVLDGYYDAYGKELILRFRSYNLGNPPIWMEGNTYSAGDIVMGSNGRQYIAYAVAGSAITSAVSTVDPSTGIKVAFDGSTTTTDSLVWNRGTNTNSDMLDGLWKRPNNLMNSCYFIPAEVGLVVKTDGTVDAIATVSFGDDFNGPASILFNQDITLVSGQSLFFFRFPISDSTKILNKGVSPQFKVVTSAETTSIVTAMPYIKGFFFQDDAI